MTDHNAEAKAEHIIASVYEAAGMSAGARPLVGMLNGMSAADRDRIVPAC